MTPLEQVQPVVAFIAKHLDQDASLAALSERAGFSPFYLHRLFERASGETPKQFTLRLRLDYAAAMLLVGKLSVLEIALNCGFQNHETFCRGFRRRFGMAPSEYRRRGFTNGANRAQAASHAALIHSLGPCVGLLRRDGEGRSNENAMEYSITKKMLPPQPVLIVRRRVKPSEIASTLAQVLGLVFLHAQQNGIALAGQPFTRYLEWGPGVLSIEAGLPVASHARAQPGADVQSDTLPAGWAATTTHTGPYDKLAEAHAAVQQWIESEGLKAQGAPWELYVTDPADVPDPKDWKTEIFWPLA